MKTELMTETDISLGAEDRFECIGTTYYKIVRQPKPPGSS